MFVISDFDSFICGFAYGTTTVIVGQPLDTIKTRMQAKGTGSSMVTTAVSIFQREGVAGLYRGLKTRYVGEILDCVTEVCRTGIIRTCKSASLLHIDHYVQRNRKFQ